MNDSKQPILIDYYTDVLCVWAWIAQPRLDELRKQHGDQVHLRHRYVDIFGDTQTKIPAAWGASDGFERFHAHVAESVRNFEETNIHPGIWSRTRPRSSMQAHLFLKAIGVAEGESALEEAAMRVRQAFFLEALDISDLSILLDLITTLTGSDTSAVQRSLNDGSAIAALSDDLRTSNSLGVKGSPTWAMNEGRQLLYGNVGYRILSANIEELINSSENDASWC
jgi:predicted DsbA family dithiol-disulfide isomerase